MLDVHIQRAFFATGTALIVIGAFFYSGLPLATIALGLIFTTFALAF